MNRDVSHKYSLVVTLKSEFDSRRKRNQSYSLRAFARDIGISASTLSRIMNSKYILNAKLIYQILDRLQITKEVKDRVIFFESCVQLESFLSSYNSERSNENILTESLVYAKSMEIDKELLDMTLWHICLINNGIFSAIGALSTLKNAHLEVKASLTCS